MCLTCRNPVGILEESMLRSDYNKAADIVGCQCSWCGRQYTAKHLFPIMLSKQGHRGRQLNNVCLECIAHERIPKDVNRSELPWYDGKGNRLR